MPPDSSGTLALAALPACTRGTVSVVQYPSKPPDGTRAIPSLFSLPCGLGIRGLVPMSFTRGGGSMTSVVRPLPGPPLTGRVLTPKQHLKRALTCGQSTTLLFCAQIHPFESLPAAPLAVLGDEPLGMKAFYCSPRLLPFPRRQRNEGLVTCAGP